MKTKTAAISLATMLISAAALAGGPGDEDNGGARLSVETLSGYSQNPPISSQGSGGFEAEVAETSDAISYELNFCNLEGLPRTANLRFGRDGEIVAYLCAEPALGSRAPVCPASPSYPNSATVSGVLFAGDILGARPQGLNPGDIHEAIRALANQQFYVEIETDLFLTGEIGGPVSYKKKAKKKVAKKKTTKKKTAFR